ncbi:hypothetical protein ACLOJK_017454 [Asimina triloba]
MVRYYSRHEVVVVFVKKPKEQVADADVLRDIASKLATSVKAHANQSVTQADFLGSLLGTYRQQGAVGSWERSRDHVSRAQIGIAVSHVFRKAPGCCTMIGPMKTELKQRKAAVRRRRSKPTKSTCPEKVIWFCSPGTWFGSALQARGSMVFVSMVLVDDDGIEEKTDTDKNMAAMFDILRQKGHVRLENLWKTYLLFPSWLKDGRAEIAINENGHHLVCEISLLQCCSISRFFLNVSLLTVSHFLSVPRNDPPARAVSSGEVCYSYFVFRFDYEDWKLMIESVRAGEGLMPHRNMQKMSGNSVLLQSDSQEAAGITSAVMLLSRNCARLVQEEECSFEGEPEKNFGTEKQS